MIFLVSCASFPLSHPSRSSGFAPSPAWKNPLENSLSSTSEIILKQLLQVKAAAVCPACLQKGDPPGKVAVYGGILPPEQGLQPPADLLPAALTCENEGAVSGCRPAWTCENEGAAYRKQTGWMEKMPGFKIRIYFHFFNTRFLQVIRSSDDGLRKAGRATDPAPETAAGHSSWWAKSRI